MSRSRQRQPRGESDANESEGSGTCCGGDAVAEERIAAATERRVRSGGRTDDIIDAVAARQHGVVARNQLLRRGVSAESVDRRLRAGRLRPLHRGVYQVGPVSVPQAAAMAASLACTGAVVSHCSAVVLWSPLWRGERPARIDVILRSGDCRKPNLRIHRRSGLRRDEVTNHQQIPITTPARTLLDFASVAASRELERALAEMCALRLTTRTELLALLRRHPKRPGVHRLRALLDAGPPALTASAAEERFLELVRRVPLPQPQVNVVVAGHRVDFYWPAERFVVEVDGYAFHASAGRFQSDRERDAALAAAGVVCIRLTWRQLVRERDAVLVRLAQALARRAPAP